MSLRMAVAFAAVSIAVPPALAQVHPAIPPDGAALYAQACRQCHGPDGRGMPAEPLGLPNRPPDFTDCQFGPREADTDWTAVIHEGGPARAFSRTMPAFGGALREDEIAAVLAHVRRFCTDRNWPRGELNLPKALVTEKAFPEDEVLARWTIDAEGDGAARMKAVYEKRIGARNQIELVAPVSAHSSPGGWAAGMGDLAVAFKRVLTASHATGTIVSLTGEVVLPTASETDGWGSGHTTVEPFLTMGQVLPGDGFFQFQGGVALPTQSGAARESFYRFVIGKTFTQQRWAREWSPMVEVLGSREHAHGHKVQWDLLPEMQVTLSTRKHIRTNVGLRIPLTDGGTRKTQLVFYLLWDWFDGGLRDGWK